MDIQPQGASARTLKLLPLRSVAVFHGARSEWRGLKLIWLFIFVTQFLSDRRSDKRLTDKKIVPCIMIDRKMMAEIFCGHGQGLLIFLPPIFLANLLHATAQSRSADYLLPDGILSN